MKNAKKTQLTNKSLQSVCERFLKKVESSFNERPNHVLHVWDEITKGKYGDQVLAERFVDGVLYVRVKSTTLFSLLELYEKRRLLVELNQRLEHTKVNKITFKND